MPARPRVLLVAIGIPVLVLSVVAWLGGRWFYQRLEDRLSVSHDSAASGALAVDVLLPALARTAGWLNAEASEFDSLDRRPTVVLLWSDTRPACVRIMPRVQAWHDAYARFGLRVVGVHEPEFRFAADTATVAAATRRLRVTFPIALDPGLEIASAAGAGVVLPRLVLFDARGHARRQATESDIADFERAIRRELRSANPRLPFPADPEPIATARAATPESSAPPTVYLGTGRATIGPLATAMPGRDQMFSAQFRYQIEGEPYAAYPVGLWKPSSEGVTAGRGGAENYVALRYDSGPLGAVLSPPSTGRVQVWILRDEKWVPRELLGADARLDGRGASYVEVDAARLYDLCRASSGQHVVKLSPEEPGLTVHAITFEPSGEPSRP